MFVDYDFYTSNFQGSSVEKTEFPSLEIKARIYIENFIRRDISTIKNENQIKKVKLCMCAVIDAIKEREEEKRAYKSYQNSLLQGDSIIASESLGKQSVTYQKAENKSLNQIEQDKIMEINVLIRLYLIGTGLLYAGIPYVV